MAQPVRNGGINQLKQNNGDSDDSINNSTNADELTKQGEFDPEAAQRAAEAKKQEAESTKEEVEFIEAIQHGDDAAAAIAAATLVGGKEYAANIKELNKQTIEANRIINQGAVAFMDGILNDDTETDADTAEAIKKGEEWAAQIKAAEEERQKKLEAAQREYEDLYGSSQSEASKEETSTKNNETSTVPTLSDTETYTPDTTANAEQVRQNVVDSFLNETRPKSTEASPDLEADQLKAKYDTAIDLVKTFKEQQNLGSPEDSDGSSEAPTEQPVDEELEALERLAGRPADPSPSPESSETEWWKTSPSDEDDVAALREDANMR